MKPNPLRDLNMHMNLKRKNDLAQVVQQQTNNVPRAKKLRMSWTPLVHEKFVESVQELGGIESMNLFPNLSCINLFSHYGHLSFHAKHFVSFLQTHATLTFSYFYLFLK